LRSLTPIWAGDFRETTVAPLVSTKGGDFVPATVWKGFLSFGLVSFPVRLFSAARAETIHFHLLHRKDQSRVKEVWYCIQENKPIDRAEIEKGYEIAKDKYVVVDDEELKNIAPSTATTMDILQFVGNDDVDPIYFESSYYVAADEKTAKPYVLFLAALTQTKQNAIAKLAMHNREHIVLIRPADEGLVLHTLYYRNELHATNRRQAPKTKYSPKELELAISLVNHLKAPFKPEQFQDTYRQNVERLIEQKRRGRKITTVEQPRKAPVIDLMEALKRSLASSGNAAKSAEARSRSRTKKASARSKVA
jgi:DNA end-binding protein Ku